MPRDYAKNSSPNRRTPNKRKKSRTGLWLVIILLLVGASAGAMYVYKHYWDTMQLHALKTHKATKSPIPLPEEANKQELVTPQFEFYNILSDGKSTASSNAAPTTNTPAPKNNATVINTNDKAAANRYVIQIASFKVNQQADQMKAKLALQGISARVNHGNDGWYRVQAGPYSSLQAAQKTQQQLQQAGYKGIVRKQNGNTNG